MDSQQDPLDAFPSTGQCKPLAFQDRVQLQLGTFPGPHTVCVSLELSDKVRCTALREKSMP